MSPKAAIDSVQVVKSFKPRDLEELYRFWAGKRGPQYPDSDEAARAAVLGWMTDSEIVEARVGIQT